ncbi:MAG TPA: hypothetical protein VFC99_19445 [Acidimicrobiia bacterium]|nr:hypothetical protein [Acidimicrobiia bacterium]
MSDVRHRLERVAEELRYLRARENDLVAEVTSPISPRWSEIRSEPVPVPDSLRLSPAQRARVVAHQRDQSRTVAAMYGLERAAGAAARAGLDRWRHELLSALIALDNATSQEQTNANRPDSILSELGRAEPRVHDRVRTLRIEYDQVRQAVGWLRRDLVQHADAPPEVAPLRREVARLLAALRDRQARTEDFLYQALLTSAGRKAAVAPASSGTTGTT